MVDVWWSSETVILDYETITLSNIKRGIVIAIKPTKSGRHAEDHQREHVEHVALYAVMFAAFY